MILKTKDLACVDKNGKYGIINKKGEEIISISYDELGSFSEGLCFVRQNNKYGIINMSENIITPIIYDFVHLNWYQGNRWVIVRNGDKYGALDRKGKEVLPCIYDQIKLEKDRAEVEKDGQTEFIPIK